MKHNGTKNILIAIFISAIFYTVWFAGTYPKAFYYVDQAYKAVSEVFARGEDMFAAVLLHQPVTVAELHTKYATPSIKKVRVLIVPGHEPHEGGTSYRNLNEREMNVELAEQLGEFLKNNGHYDVMLARNNDSWSPTLEEYFKNNWDGIIAYYKDNKAEMKRLVDTGVVKKVVSPVTHNKARTDMALRLYGINKWESENAVDIAIHVHFNDVPRANTSVPGEYSGIAMYIPQQNYANNPTTAALVSTIFKRLSKYNAVSNLENENEGIVEESDLIAIGAHNTTNSASMLIEYGYVYEPQFQDPEVRQATLRDLAFETYLGLQDFFGSGNDVTLAFDTLMLPHEWRDDLSKTQGSTSDVLALQSALMIDGVYPPTGRTANDCPRTGKIGPCTVTSINLFQKKYGIKGEEGMVGTQTKKVLNDKFSVKRI